MSAANTLRQRELAAEATLEFLNQTDLDFANHVWRLLTAITIFVTEHDMSDPAFFSASLSAPNLQPIVAFFRHEPSSTPRTSSWKRRGEECVGRGSVAVMISLLLRSNPLLELVPLSSSESISKPSLMVCGVSSNYSIPLPNPDWKSFNTHFEPTSSLELYRAPKETTIFQYLALYPSRSGGMCSTWDDILDFDLLRCGVSCYDALRRVLWLSSAAPRHASRPIERSRTVSWWSSRRPGLRIQQQMAFRANSNYGLLLSCLPSIFGWFWHKCGLLRKLSRYKVSRAETISKLKTKKGEKEKSN